jgi:hypothetical protein
VKVKKILDSAMLNEKLNKILAMLAEQEGAWLLCFGKNRTIEGGKISPCPFAVERRTATLFWQSPY